MTDFQTPTEILVRLGYCGAMEGVKYWKSTPLVDSRGSFVKSYTHQMSQLDTPFGLHEVFTSTSLPGVVRGFHLQTGMSENFRIIQVLSGRVLDVLLDLRTDSATYKTFETRELTYGSNETLLIPPGVAHGFQALELSTMLYLTSSDWDPLNDKGVSPVTSGFQWPLEITKLSDRDQQLPSLEQYVSRQR